MADFKPLDPIRFIRNSILRTIVKIRHARLGRICPFWDEKKLWEMTSITLFRESNPCENCLVEPFLCPAMTYNLTILQFKSFMRDEDIANGKLITARERIKLLLNTGYTPIHPLQFCVFLDKRPLEMLQVTKRIHDEGSFVACDRCIYFAEIGGTQRRVFDVLSFEAMALINGVACDGNGFASVSTFYHWEEITLPWGVVQNDLNAVPNRITYSAVVSI